MAIAIARPQGVNDYTAGNRRHKIRTLTFSGNYATGGETLTKETLGFRRIDAVYPHGACALSTDLATANPVGFNISSTGASVVVLQYEGSAAGTAISEKTNGEAYATGSNIRVTILGQ